MVKDNGHRLLGLNNNFPGTKHWFPRHLTLTTRNNSSHFVLLKIFGNNPA